MSRHVNIEDRNLSGNNSQIEKWMPKFNLKSFTFKITLVQVGCYLLSILLGDGKSPSLCSLLMMGGKYTPFIVEKWEVWRLILPILLHGSIMHLASNLFFQLRFGFAIEEYYGVKRFVVIYLISGVGGNLLSAVGNLYSISTGASGSLFGLFAVLGCFYAYNWNNIGIGRNFNIFIYTCFLIYSFGISFTEPGIDYLAHIGGCLSGACLGIIFIPDLESSQKWKRYKLMAFSTILLSFSICIFLLINTEVECLKYTGYDDCSICYGLTLK